MNVILDTNVLLDVFQKREPHYASSAKVLSAVTNGEVTAYLSLHVVTTLFFLIGKYTTPSNANAALEWILKYCEIPVSDKSTLIEAKNLAFSDFEDALLAQVAKESECQYIITRNGDDFSKSPVEAITPQQFFDTVLNKK